LDRCLESLSAYPPACDHQIVVVDNASSDSGLEDVHQRYPACQWIFNAENWGYSKGCNLGMAAAPADYYLILNPDIVVQPGALDRLLGFADRHPRAGMVGPQLLNEDGSIQESCRRFYTFKTLLLRRTFLSKIFPNSDTVRLHLMQDFDHKEERPVDWVLGGCLLVRASAMERTGPMDERFFLYFEDVDWCYRMWQAGFEVVYFPDARFVHKHRRDSAKGRFNKSFWLHLGSLISFYEKWGILVWLLKKWRDPLLMMLWWALDMLALVAAFGSAYGLRSVAGGLFSEPLYAASEYTPLFWFAGMLASAVFWLTGRYRAGQLRARRAVGEHLRQIGIVGVLLLASTYLGHQEVISRAVLLAFIPLLAVATALGEGILRRLIKDLEKGHLSLERTLLVGAPASLQKWLDGSHDLAKHGIDLAGYIADDAVESGMPALSGGSVPWLGSQASAEEVVRRYRISQVVFWDAPRVDTEHSSQDWQLIATLRRLRVRLRWYGGGAWLLATGARPELFGDQLSAVQGANSGLALRTVTDRALAILLGLGIGVMALLPWLWLKLVAGGNGRCSIQALKVIDVWGHENLLTMAMNESGEAMPLFWQWRLAWPLLCGKLNMVGPQGCDEEHITEPRTAPEVLAFWQSIPKSPGLTGAWCAPDENDSLRRLGAMWNQLWLKPGGFRMP
jgi:GT2 family glycosyltransferase